MEMLLDKVNGRQDDVGAIEEQQHTAVDQQGHPKGGARVSFQEHLDQYIYQDDYNEGQKELWEAEKWRFCKYWD